MTTADLQSLTDGLSAVALKAKSRGVHVGLCVLPNGQVEVWLAEKAPLPRQLTRAESVPVEGVGVALAAQFAAVRRRGSL